MTLEVHMSMKDDSRCFTFWVLAWDIIISLILIKMEFYMISRFVHRGEVVKSNFVGLSRVPETEDALRRCWSLGKGLMVGGFGFVLKPPWSIRSEP